MAGKLGLTPQTAPGFRGLLSLFFTGNGGTERPGFMWGSNNYNLAKVWARIRDKPRSFSEDYLTRTNSAGLVDVNFAHLIYEALVDRSFGMGGDPKQIDEESFRVAAQTLYNEGLCGTLAWTKQGPVEGYIQELLNHIDGIFFFDPRTGKAKLRLLRDDYDPETVPIIDASNAQLVKFRRQLWGETVNELVITYTSAVDESKQTIIFQSLGNIAMQGEVVSESRDYYAFRTEDVASIAGSRDIAKVSVPLATAVVKLNRTEWGLQVGDVRRLQFPKDGIGNVVMRCVDIDYGKKDDAVITATFLEDIYAFGRADYLPSQPPLWVDPSLPPNSDQAQLDPFFFAVPFPLLARYGAAQYLKDENYPKIIVGVVAVPSDPDVQSFMLDYLGTNTSGEPEWMGAGEKEIGAKGKLGRVLPQEVVSTVTFTEIEGAAGPQVGGFVIVGGTKDAEDEWIYLHSYNEDGSWNAWRAVFDTVPKRWPLGTKVYFIPPFFNAVDTSEKLAFTNLHYKLLARTSLGVMDLAVAAERVANLPDRLYLPFRPANVKVEGVMFGTADLRSNEPRKWTLTITWSNRNRHLEDAVFLRWDQGDVVPEDGQTTSIIIDSGDGLQRFDGLTGTRFDYDITQTAIPHD